MQNSGSEEDLQQLMDQRKRKRMISNRESARRSRMRKQKHLDDLMIQATRLGKENNQILTSLNITTQHYLNIERENSVLRAQVAELNNRLQSLNEIINIVNATNYGGFVTDDLYPVAETPYGLMNNNNPWNYQCLNQPIMPSTDMLLY